MINSVDKRHKNYYPQVFLKECKYVAKEKKKVYTDNIEISSDDFDKEDSDEKNYHEKT